MITNNETKYEDVFSSNIEEQIRVTDILFLKLEARRRLISCSEQRVPVDPRRANKAPRLGIQKAKNKNNKKTNNSNKNKF